MPQSLSFDVFTFSIIGDFVRGSQWPFIFMNDWELMSFVNESSQLKSNNQFSYFVI